MSEGDWLIKGFLPLASVALDTSERFGGHQGGGGRRTHLSAALQLNSPSPDLARGDVEFLQEAATQ